MGEARLSESAPYPAYREADVVLRDGSTVHLRPVRSGRRGGAAGAFCGARRRLAHLPLLLRRDRPRGRREAARRRRLRAPLRARRHARRRGPARRPRLYARPDRAQRRGGVRGRRRAPGHGLARSCSPISPRRPTRTASRSSTPRSCRENHRMIEVFRESGFPVETPSVPGVDPDRVPDLVLRRGRGALRAARPVAAAGGRAALPGPRSVAVIGASRRRGTVGGEIFHNLLEAGFDGRVYPVNPARDVVQSVRAYRSGPRCSRATSTWP